MFAEPAGSTQDHHRHVAVERIDLDVGGQAGPRTALVEELLGDERRPCLALITDAVSDLVICSLLMVSSAVMMSHP